MVCHSQYCFIRQKTHIVIILFIALEKRLFTCISHLQARITTRLQQYRTKAELSRNTRPQAWVPREKLPRPLTSSASAIRKLMRKAELMGISTDIFPVDTSDASASIDGRRKHKQPALSAEFVNYYLGKKNQTWPGCIFLTRLQNCSNQCTFTPNVLCSPMFGCLPTLGSLSLHWWFTEKIISSLLKLIFTCFEGLMKDDHFSVHISRSC